MQLNGKTERELVSRLLQAASGNLSKIVRLFRHSDPANTVTIKEAERQLRKDIK